MIRLKHKGGPPPPSDLSEAEQERLRRLVENSGFGVIGPGIGRDQSGKLTPSYARGFGDIAAEAAASQRRSAQVDEAISKARRMQSLFDGLDPTSGIWASIEKSTLFMTLLRRGSPFDPSSIDLMPQARGEGLVRASTLGMSFLERYRGLEAVPLPRQDLKPEVIRSIVREEVLSALQVNADARPNRSVPVPHLAAPAKEKRRGGRPAMDVRIFEEYRRRVQAGETARTLKEDAVALAEWFRHYEKRGGAKVPSWQTVLKHLGRINRRSIC